MENQNAITSLLHDLCEGNTGAADALMPLIYEHLQKIAHNQLYRERRGHTLNATALVHEAYFVLVNQKRSNWQNRAHFYAIAARVMRRILINYAQSRNAQKRGGGAIVATFDEQAFVRETRAAELIALDDAMQMLAKLNERQSRVVELRFFGGLTQEEIAEVIGVSVATVRLDWRMARAWLSQKLEQEMSL